MPSTHSARVNAIAGKSTPTSCGHGSQRRGRQRLPHSGPRRFTGCEKRVELPTRVWLVQAEAERELAALGVPGGFVRRLDRPSQATDEIVETPLLGEHQRRADRPARIDRLRAVRRRDRSTGNPPRRAGGRRRAPAAPRRTTWSVRPRPGVDGARRASGRSRRSSISGGPSPVRLEVVLAGVLPPGVERLARGSRCRVGCRGASDRGQLRPVKTARSWCSLNDTRSVPPATVGRDGRRSRLWVQVKVLSPSRIISNGSIPTVVVAGDHRTDAEQHEEEALVEEHPVGSDRVHLDAPRLDAVGGPARHVVVAEQLWRDEQPVDVGVVRHGRGRGRTGSTSRSPTTSRCGARSAGRGPRRTARSTPACDAPSAPSRTTSRRDRSDASSPSADRTGRPSAGAAGPSRLQSSGVCALRCR